MSLAHPFFYTLTVTKQNVKLHKRTNALFFEKDKAFEIYPIIIKIVYQPTLSHPAAVYHAVERNLLFKLS